MRPSIVLIGGATICLACTGAADSPPRGDAEWELVEDLRLDANVEDFSLVGRLYVGPQHEIVVPEPQDDRLRLYDSTGTLVAAIGRRGSGPGEFQHVGVGFWAADTLVVWDGRFARSYAHGGEPIPDSALDRAIAAMTSESERDRRARYLARERAPAVYAPIGVTLGLDGTVWVELRSTDRGTPVVVISEAGDSIGSLLLPMRTKIRQAGMTHVWVTETDALDLASVVRYQVIRRN